MKREGKKDEQSLAKIKKMNIFKKETLFTGKAQWYLSSCSQNPQID